MIKTWLAPGELDYETIGIIGTGIETVPGEAIQGEVSGGA
jgi:hypothetical protein